MNRAVLTSGCVLAAAVAAAAAGAGARMSATGDYALPEKAYVISDVLGYNSWPMIQAVGTKLFCSYSRDNARPKDGHTISPGSRDSYLRLSADGGRTWSDEITVAADPKIGEVNEGIGLDETGAALLWVRCWGKDRRHELYRTADGRAIEKIASIRPDPFPMQIMDPVRVEGLGLVSPWFAGNYREGGSNSWGLFVSADNGRTWTQRTIEKGLSVKEWVTEPSLVDLGGGRLLIVGRCEQGLGTQFQVTSVDGGKTWKKARTNIGDVRESTPSLVYDAKSGLVANYYYHRGARKLKRRVARADFIFSNPDRWPEPEVLDEGFERRPHDAGNVKATRLGDADCCAWYTGTPSNSTVVVTVVPAATRTAAEMAQWARPDLVEKVARGELTEAEVSWWGYDSADSTPYIQAALRSKARKVTLDRREGPWFTRPLWGRSDLTLVVPQGVELCAKRGEFHRSADFLLRFNCATNVTLTGGGTIRMWFEDYTNKAFYAWSEWRHAVAILSCHRVLIENLRIADSGGDGLYIGTQGRVRASTDVTVRNVTFSRNNRQGISVISADRLLIEDCVMENTCGTPPMAGIDFEPNGPSQMLRDIVVRRCTVRGNKGAGFDFSVGNLSASSPPISILLEDCRSVGNSNPTKFHRSADVMTRFHGAVTFRRCEFNDLDGGRGTFRSPTGRETMSVAFEDCRAADPEKGGELTPLGPEYGWERIQPLTWQDGTEVRIEATPLPDMARVKVYDSAPGKPVRLRPLHIRGEAEYLVYADAARKLHFKVALRAVGRSKPVSCRLTLHPPSGAAAKVHLEPVFGKVQEVAFKVPSAGFCRLAVRTGGSHVMYFTETDAPIALVADSVKLPGWSGLPGEVHLRVPEGCGKLALSASGGGGNELVHVKLFDPSGTCVWDADNTGATTVWFAPGRPAAGLWRLESVKASKGCMDDYSFGVFGIPYRLFLSPEKTWTEPLP